MARSRNLKPGFYKNEFLAQVSPHARLLFAGLWLLADRRGRLEDRPLRIKGELFPFEAVEAETLLQELANSSGRFITRYEINGERFIQIENFYKHQNPHHREAESTIPPWIERKPQASPGLSPTQVVPSLGNSGTSRADSLLLIPDSLTPETGNSESNDSVCVSVNGLEKENDENQRFAQEGMDYLISLNSPNHTNIGWVRGYLAVRFLELEQSRPELSKPQILACWRDVCDLAISKNGTAPQWFKTTFKNKLEVLTPETLKPSLLEAVRDQGKELLSFPLIWHRHTGEIFESKNLQVLPDAPNGLTDQRGTYYPFTHLEGLQEVSPNA